MSTKPSLMDGKLLILEVKYMGKAIMSGIPSKTVIIGRGRSIVTIDGAVENLFAFEAPSSGNSTRLAGFNGVPSTVQETETRARHLPPVERTVPLNGHRCSRMAESKLT